MNVEQIYTRCLAQGAYYISSNGEAAIIDPIREVAPYMERLEQDKVKLKYIFETHFHADFVSGHLSLAKRTGASIVYGPTAEPNFEAIIANDNQEFKIGDLTIVVLHTPGHTMESSCYLLRDKAGNDIALFSGDTLFLGDVGRPDLAQHGDLTTEKLAGILYDSLRNKVMPLGDDVTIYPGHGAGSACGKNMSDATVDTLGNQKKTNYALRADMTKEEFIKEATEGIPAPPAYFPMNAKLNKAGYADIDEILKRGLTPLLVEEFENKANQSDVIILDVRNQVEFSKGHIPNSIFIGLKGGFAPWVGTVIGDVNTPILLVTNEGEEEETVVRLARVGFDQVLGYLKGGFTAWENAAKPVGNVEIIETDKFVEVYKTGDIPVFDVRKDGEFNVQHVINAKHTSLSKLEDYLNEFPKDKTFYIHCQGGYRSMIAASILKRNGFSNFVDVNGGFVEIKETDIVTDAVCCNAS